MKILYKGGWIADGTGAPLHRGCLLTEDGIIAAVGRDYTSCAADAVEILPADAVLAPGFIDAHAHSDISLLAAPAGFGKISQGITSEICGNCGLSAFPLTKNNREHLSELYHRYGIGLDWNDYSGWIQAAAVRGTVPRVFALTGHNTLRAAVTGYEKKQLCGNELDEMRRLLSEELACGSLGLSAGLLYVPGKFAETDETAALMREVQYAGGIYATHLRSEGAELLESLDETLHCAREAGLKKVQISHFKTAGRNNWPKLDAALKLIDEAEKDGIRITVDRYPYTAAMTQLSVILPAPYDDMDDAALMKALAAPEVRSQVARMLRAERAETYWDDVQLISTGVPKYAGGGMLSELARKELCHPAELTVELLAEDATGTSAAFHGMSEDNLRRIMQLPYCMMGSDESTRPEDYSIGRSHPRGFGAAADFVRRLLDANINIEEAVRRLTALPAETFNLGNIGKLKPGKAADLAVFLPDEIRGNATFISPHTPASGIILTAVAGKTVYRS